MTNLQPIVNVSNLTPEIMAEALYSGVVTLGRDKGKLKANLELPRAILVDMQRVAFLDISNEGIVRNSSEARASLNQRLSELMSNTTIEFVYYDEVTQSMFAFTDSYLTKLETGEAKIIELVMSYFDLWYIKKCGHGKNKTEAHYEMFKTFSKTEVEYLRRELIPIATVPHSLTAIYNAIEYAIQVSPLHAHITKDTGFNVKGTRLESATTWWINLPIAKMYLGVESDFDVLSSVILNKLLEDAGFSDKPARLEIQELKIDLSEMNLNSVDDLIALKHGFAEDNMRQKEIKRIISTNALDDDSIFDEPKVEADKAHDLTSIDLDWH